MNKPNYLEKQTKDLTVFDIRKAIYVEPKTHLDSIGFLSSKGFEYTVLDGGLKRQISFVLKKDGVSIFRINSNRKRYVNIKHG